MGEIIYVVVLGTCRDNPIGINAVYRFLPVYKVRKY